MAGYLLMAEDATSWPDAFVAVGGFALIAFMVWMFLHD